MKQSELFTKTRREAPADEVAKNAQLLVRAGYIHKEMAGVYDYLPLGLRVINRIKKIVADEMEALGSTEILMSTLQEKALWEKTDRWSDEKVDVWFKSRLQSGSDVGFGWSHEEPITAMMRSHVSSYNDLPRYVHQFQNKLRNEVRAKAGIMRCREFIMKDMYSYARDENEHMAFYNKATEAYMNVFRKVGLGDRTYVTSASGGFFTDKFSHEFQTVCDAGEDTIYVHKDGSTALNGEVFNEETLAKLGMHPEDFEAKKAAEVGNIFTFGTKKCEELGLMFKNATGESKPVFLGSYGIGITLLMGTIVEVFADEKGLVWPESVAPFKYHIVSLGKEGDEISQIADALYNDLMKADVEVLYDDRDMSAGQKFADSDLLGIPKRIVVGKDAVATGKFEIVDRKTGVVTKVVPREELLF
jgi:prolyl-tRNA synthetase